jgi:periplasmic mercuric ion binding protein
MKSLINRFVLIGAALALPFSLFAGPLQSVTLDVQNMFCAVCPITVKKALERVPGVTDAKVDFDKKTASISFDPDKASTDTLKNRGATQGTAISPSARTVTIQKARRWCFNVRGLAHADLGVQTRRAK